MMKNAPLTMAIVGAGRMGTSLALSLTRLAHYRLRFAISRSEASAEALCRTVGQGTLAQLRDLRAGVDLVWLTVPDRELVPLSHELARQAPFQGNPLFIHTSGCFSIESLRPLRQAGQKVAGMHPLQSVASRGQTLKPGSFYALEQESDRPELLRQLVTDLHGKPFKIPAARKALYHAAAAVASNYLVVLAAASMRMLHACGLEAHTATDALSMLVSGTWDNVTRLGPTEALTGPVQRADLQVVSEHLMAVGSLGDRSLMELYTVLGRLTTDLAIQQGSLSEAQAEAMRRLLGGV